MMKTIIPDTVFYYFICLIKSLIENRIWSESDQLFDVFIHCWYHSKEQGLIRWNLLMVHQKVLFLWWSLISVMTLLLEDGVSKKQQSVLRALTPYFYHVCCFYACLVFLCFVSRICPIEQFWNFKWKTNLQITYPFCR